MWGKWMIQGLWYRQVEAIIDVKLGNDDADSYKYEPMAALLAWWKTIKKDKNSKNFNDQRKHFSPFVLSVDGIIGRGALIVLAQLSQTMAYKKVQTSFAIMWVDKWSNCNRGCKILIMYDPRSSTTQ